MAPILYIVIPCYNEEQVLPVTAPMFLKKITDLAAAFASSLRSLPVHWYHLFVSIRYHKFFRFSMWNII